MKITSEKLLIPFFVIVTFLILILGVKGFANYPNFFQISNNTAVEGPFEASNSTSRYALTESIVDNHSFFFNQTQAKFATPDLVKYNNKYFTIFTPGVSFLGIPFYIIGDKIGYTQILTYLSVTLTALLNLFLVYLLAQKFGASKPAALLSGMIFLFATNAFPYAFSYTQHHLSTALILLALLNAAGKRSFLNDILFGFIFGAGILADIPNVFMMAPIGIYIFFAHFEISNIVNKIKISFKLYIFGFLIGIIPLLFIFALYNHTLTGSYTKIAQLIGRSDYGVQKTVVKQAAPSIYDQKLAFQTRNELNGFYILLLSDERSWLMYSPIVLFGILGMVLIYRKKKMQGFGTVAIAVVLVDIIIYSMFSDPWGGWSFGARYLIPAAAILCSAIGLAFEKYKGNYLFLFMLILSLLYSIYISTLSVATTTSIPPKQESLALGVPIPFTYQYNLQLSGANKSDLYIYGAYFSRYLSVNEFVDMYAGLIIMITLVIIGSSLFKPKRYVYH